MFKVGQKVVFKRDDSDTIPSYLVYNKIYTIKDIFTSPKGNLSFLLEEVYNGERIGYPYFYGYAANRFEPLKYDLISNKDIIKEIITERLDVPMKELEPVN